jgi:hypothetical protein
VGRHAHAYANEFNLVAFELRTTASAPTTDSAGAHGERSYGWRHILRFSLGPIRNSSNQLGIAIMGKPSTLFRSVSGVVYVEFLICFIPVFLCFLGIVQLAFIASAKLVVQHAAITGARSAIVVLEDDNDAYAGEGFGVIDYNGSSNRPSSLQEKLSGILPSVQSDQTPIDPTLLDSRGGPRLRDIRSAVYMPLLAISPSIDQIGQWFVIGLDASASLSDSTQSLKTAIGNRPELRLLAGLLYNRVASAVTFPSEPGSRSFIQGAFGPTDLVTVRVTYLYPCAVPLVSRFMCNSLLDISGLSRSITDIRHAIENINLSRVGELQQTYHQITRGLPNRADETAQTAQEMGYAEMPGLLLPLMAMPTRFVALRAEATMQIQGADYYRR